MVIPSMVTLSVNVGIMVQNGGLEKLTPSINTFLHSYVVIMGGLRKAFLSMRYLFFCSNSAFSSLKIRCHLVSASAPVLALFHKSHHFLPCPSKCPSPRMAIFSH